MAQLENPVEELLLSRTKPDSGANKHGMGRTGGKETDAPCIPALQPWQGEDIPWGFCAPLPQLSGEGRGFSSRSQRNENLQMLILRAPIKQIRDLGRWKKKKLFNKP